MIGELRPEPLSRIPDELLRTVMGLLQAYEDRNNPAPIAEDIASRLGESAEVIERACRKLERRGLLVVSLAEDGSTRSYSLPVAEKSSPVPEELLKAVVDLVRAYEDRSNPPPTTLDMAAGLGLNEREVRLACSTLEADGLVRPLHTSQLAGPGYATAGERAPAVTQAPATTPEPPPEPAAASKPDPASEADTPESVRDRKRMVFALVRSTARVFKSELDIDVQMEGGEVREDEATSEDLSVFLRVNGQIEGSVYYGMNRAVALELLSTAQRRPIGGVDAESLLVLNTLVGRIGDHIRGEFAAAGFSVEISPASTVQPAGTKITTRGIPQIVANLKSEFGPIYAHVSLRKAVVETPLAA
ncbi:MAG: chemotaxis protein CheX [Dehalococcoidia bacterium]|nr:chemotaxis protein CheX [Dehalococcoidia bacterium]